MKITRRQLRRIILNEFVRSPLDSEGQYDPVEDLAYEVMTKHNLVGLILDRSNTKNKDANTLFVVRGRNEPLTDITYVKKVKEHLSKEMPEYEILVKPDQLNKSDSAFVIQINK